MNNAGRRVWILISNTALLLLTIYGIYSEVGFYRSRQKYGLVPLPLSRTMVQILQEKAWSFGADSRLGHSSRVPQTKVARYCRPAGIYADFDTVHLGRGFLGD